MHPFKSCQNSNHNNLCGHVVYLLTNFLWQAIIFHILCSYSAPNHAKKPQKQFFCTFKPKTLYKVSEKLHVLLNLPKSDFEKQSFRSGRDERQLSPRVCNAERIAERISEWNWLTPSHCLVSRVSSMSGTAADLPVISDIEAVIAVNRALGPGWRLALRRC